MWWGKAPVSDAAPENPVGRLKGPALAVFIAATVAAIAPALTQPNEGFKGNAYFDPAHILTQCYGETQGVRPDVVYSKDQCAAKLRLRMAQDYAPAIIACVPDFADPTYQTAFGAALDAAYNAGPRAVCKSPMARAFNAGDWTAGCRLFPGWYVSAKGVRYPGLVRRRQEEMAYCLGGSTK